MGNHELYMKRVIELAKGGWGKTNPNPLVGAVVVKNNEIIGEGFHEALGGAHAEVSAIRNATQSLEGSTLYVNLEPCSHYGRTPPCAEAIIGTGISEVVIAMVDPNPKVSGKGVFILEDAGIKVTVGILEEEAKKLNEIFIKYITQKKPFVIMKSAMTLDGKIASTYSDSKWITGETAREYVHVLRDRMSGIMVGINTVIKDNPSLTARLPGKKCKDPVRIIVDSKGKIPLESNLLKVCSDAGVLLATTSSIDKKKEEQLLNSGVGIIKTEDRNGKVDLGKLMVELYRLEIDSVLLEGGGTLNASALDAGIVDKVMMFVAPKIIGGHSAKTPVEGDGKSRMKDAFLLSDVNVSMLGSDVLIEGYIKNDCKK